MSEQKQPTYAANNKQIAKSLGLRTSRRQLAEIGQWRLRPDFPTKQRQGYVIEELREWHGRYGKAESERRRDGETESADSPIHRFTDSPSAQPEDAADKLRAAREKAYLQDFAEGKPLEKFTDEGRAVLEKHGLLESQRAEVGGQRSEGKVTTQKAILPHLQLHYRGRLEHEITQQNISDWHNGRNLPGPDAPPAPHKEGNYFLIAQWLEWFDRWVLPYWGLEGGPDEGDLFDPRQISRLRRTNDVEDLLHQKFLRECDQGLWVKKSELGPAIDAAVRTWCDELDRVEQLIPKHLEADLKALADAVPVKVRMTIMDQVRARCQEFNDGLRRAIQQKLAGLKPEQNGHAA